MSYEPMRVCGELGIPIRRIWLRDTWGAWIPQQRTIVLAEGLSPVQERCVLAHEVEHAIARDQAGCGSGPYADRPAVRSAFSTSTKLQERRADLRAARKLIAISDLTEAAQWPMEGLQLLAAELQVTERMLRVRLADVPGEGWPWQLETLRTAG